MAIDRKVISEWVTTSEIIADTWGGLWICARPTWGYNLDWIIDTLYISKSWIDISWADAFYSIMNIAWK
jgi:hypothetical protein